MNNIQDPQTKIFLQCYTTGFKKRIDQVYAYGILEVIQEDFQYSFSIRDPISDDEFFFSQLEKKIKPWASQKKSIFMFNGGLELDLCEKFIPNIKDFYRDHVVDLYTELRNHKLFVPQTTFSLQHLSELAGHKTNITLGPDLYETFYPFHIDNNARNLEQEVRNNLTSMYYIQTFYQNILNSLSQKNPTFHNQITKAEMQGTLLTVTGKNKVGRAIFYHNPHIYYEESSAGDYTLKLSTIYSRYKDDIYCHSLPYPYKVDNPKPMPQGYILLSINSQFYVQQIHAIINDLRKHF